MWELDYKESWAPKNWYFWTVVLEKILESHLDSEEIQPVHPEGNQSWIFIWRTDIEAETPLLWPPNTKNWLIGKDPDAGTDWRWEEQGMTEDEMIGWHHRLNGHEIEKALGVGDGQGSLVCCSPWGCKEWNDWATELNWSYGKFLGYAIFKNNEGKLNRWGSLQEDGFKQVVSLSVVLWHKLKNFCYL